MACRPARSYFLFVGVGLEGELISKEPTLERLNFEPFKISDLAGESTSHAAGPGDPRSGRSAAGADQGTRHGVRALEVSDEMAGVGKLLESRISLGSTQLSQFSARQRGDLFQARLLVQGELFLQLFDVFADRIERQGRAGQRCAASMGVSQRTRIVAARKFLMLPGMLPRRLADR